jgi:hypothetical protein
MFEIQMTETALTFGHLDFEFVSCFGFRYSNLWIKSDV